MISVLHLIDDNRLGGVTRGVADLARRLGPAFGATVRTLPTVWRLAPRVVADVIVIDFTLSWAKLAFLLSLRLRFRGPVIIVEHSYTAAYERERVRARGRFRLLLRLCFRLVDRVVAVSHGQAAWMLDARLLRPRHLVTIPQEIDVEAASALPPARRAPGPLRLGAYGRFTAQKGFDVLIEAMRHVPPQVATLTLAGYGEDEPALRQAAAGLAAAGLHHVRIEGPCDGPAGFLSGIDCVVVPSRWEAYGLVGLEARAAGRPLIATAVDGLVEQVAPAWGELVRPNDPVSLAAAIGRMAERDLAPMGAASRISARGCPARKVAAWRRLLLEMACKTQPRLPASVAECNRSLVAGCESLNRPQAKSL